jgi:ubiquinone/menaquinone biosynthesis C-methylase UbiE
MKRSLGFSQYLRDFSLRRQITYLLPGIRLGKDGSVWEEKSIVKLYNSAITLHKPEQIILNSLRPSLSKMKMLDIGVGAGRTTIHFAPLAREYVGIDYSANMVDACKKKFSENKKWLFKVVDATNLQVFKDSDFDFVMFSFNGLDYILDHQNRKKAICEIWRVLKPNGIFYFTTHNLNYLWRFCDFKSFSFNEIRRMLLMRIYNWKSWRIIRQRNKNITHLTANNGTHNFGTSNYFISPKYQITALRELGFKEIRVYDLEGKFIEQSSVDENDDNSYLHYLCKK